MSHAMRPIFRFAARLACSRPCGPLLVGFLIAAAASVTLITASPQPKDRYARSDARLIATDHAGIKHNIGQCAETRRFQNSGTPFSGAVALAPEIEAHLGSLSTVIALNMHTPRDQMRIAQSAIDRGMFENQVKEWSQVILMIPLISVETITLGPLAEPGFALNGNDRQTSLVKVAGRPLFEAGTAYADLDCREDMGSLGSGRFSAWLEDLKELRAAGEPRKFEGDLSTFGVHVAPFKATVTDTGDKTIVLERATFCGSGVSVRDRSDGYIGNIGYASVPCSSDLPVKRGDTTSASIPSTNLRRVEFRKTKGSSGYQAQVTLRSGEAIDLMVGSTHDNGGILGVSPDGWVWVPWSAVWVLELPE